MTFLAPGLLLLGLAAAVPILLHLFQRHQGPRMAFPALRYLRRAEREHATRIRLRQVLLLALRVLALLLLAAAAARPLVTAAGGGHEPTSIVLVLDNSVSSGAIVGDARVLDLLREPALRTLEAAGPDDRFWLIRAGATWEPALSGDPLTVADAVRATEPAAGAADLGAEVARATSILAAEAEGRPTEIHLLSDLQTSSLRAAEPAPGAPPVVVLDIGRPLPPNRGVTAVEVGGGLPPRSGERSTVTAAIGGEHGDSVSARLVLDGAVRAAVRVPPGAAAVLPFPARDEGLVTGHVEIDADALVADDRRYFVARVEPPPTVGLAGTAEFVDEALDVLEEAGRIRRAAVGSAALVVSPGGRGADVVRAGRDVVVLPPSTPLELSAANQRLAAAGIPWRFGTPRPGEARLETADDELGGVLDEVRVREVYELEGEGAGGDTAFVRLATGEAWAVGGATDAGGRYVVLATPLTLEASTIPTSAAMLPLLDRALGPWTRAEPAERQYQPGDVVTLPAGDSVVGAGGSVTAAPGEVFRLERPGVYRLFRGGEVEAAYAVNPPPAESDLRRAEPAVVAEQLGGRETRMATAEGWSAAVFQRRTGREISLPLLAAALLVLLVEAAVAATGRGARRRAPSSEPAQARAPAGGAA